MKNRYQGYFCCCFVVVVVAAAVVVVVVLILDFISFSCPFLMIYFNCMCIGVLPAHVSV